MGIVILSTITFLLVSFNRSPSQLLRKAGLTLAEDNSVFDNIIGYFIEKGIYDPIEIDEYLVEFGQSPMFSVA
ncbi:hypothetical protein [Oceanobacillus sp. Castelsardo]|uniref:hypothetical protein n=1 Tax=Oceanobacillus sp. Castelsardo TaxID=1851204 RepID=UPI001E652398|nr:hypothetical protein [Oceanobacillus sp. Castelsardo]